MDVEKTEAKLKETKKTIKGVVWLVGIIIILIVIVRSCIGCGDGEDKKTDEQKTQDSLSFIEYVYENSELTDFDVKIEFEDKKFVRVTIPEDMGNVSEVIGRGVCLLFVKWLAENNYSTETFPFVSVQSPSQGGVMKRDDMIIPWGTARYYYTTDNIEWKSEQ